MLLIKGKAQIIIEKDDFGDEYDDEGMLSFSEATAYTSNIPSDLQSMLNTAGTGDMYIWETKAMENNGLDVKVTTDDFYIIDYSDREVYSSIGYELDGNTYYSLTQLQALNED